MYFKYCFLVISIYLTPVASQMRIQDQQVYFLLKVMENLSLNYKFDNLIAYRIQNPAKYNKLNLTLSNEMKLFLSDPKRPIERIFTQFAQTPVMVFNIDPRTYGNDTTVIPNLSNVLTNKNLAIVILTDLMNKKLREHVAISLSASIETKIVYLLLGFQLTGIRDFERMQKMQTFFRWCWAKNLLNVILVFQKDYFANASDLTMEIYTYTPFPKPIQLICLTSMPDTSQYFTQKTVDLQGYKFKSPVWSDKPHVFKMTNRKTGKTKISGNIGRLFAEFVHKINGTFVELPSDNIDAKNSFTRLLYTVNILKEGLIDIGIHPFSFLVTNRISGSYPVTNSNSCVILPVIPEIDRAYYIPYTFNATIWLYLLIIFALYALLHMLGYYQRFQRIDPDVAFGVTLTGMLNLPTRFMLYDNLKNGMVTQRLMQISLTITGLIFTQMYVTSLASLLSTTIYGQQLETLEDLRAANITLMVLDHQYIIYTNSNILPKNFSSNVIIQDSETISRHQASLNTSFGYIVFQEEWKVMRRLQASLWKPVFRIASKLCIPNVYLALPTKFLHFMSPSKCLHYGLKLGLDEKWSEMVYSDIQQSSVTEDLVDDLERPASITLEHLLVLWYIWAGGILLALSAFCAELYLRRKSLV